MWIGVCVGGLGLQPQTLIHTFTTPTHPHQPMCPCECCGFTSIGTGECSSSAFIRIKRWTLVVVVPSPATVSNEGCGGCAWLAVVKVSMRVWTEEPTHPPTPTPTPIHTHPVLLQERLTFYHDLVIFSQSRLNSYSIPSQFLLDFLLVLTRFLVNSAGILCGPAIPQERPA